MFFRNEFESLQKEKKRRVLYFKEFKLLIISYTLIKEVSNVRINELKFINKYFVAKKLKIIIFIFKN